MSMHKESYKYVGRLSDGTTVMFTKQHWVVDAKDTMAAWMPETTMNEIFDAYNEFKEMMN